MRLLSEPAAAAKALLRLRLPPCVSCATALASRQRSFSVLQQLMYACARPATNSLQQQQAGRHATSGLVLLPV
jgi:hypothetical protein